REDRRQAGHRDAHAVALREVEHLAVAEARHAARDLLSAAVALSEDLPGPVDDRQGLLALAHGAAVLPGLAEGEPEGRIEAGGGQEEGADAAVGVAGVEVAGHAGVAAPGHAPGHDAVLELLEDVLVDDVVNAHGEKSWFRRKQEAGGRRT